MQREADQRRGSPRERGYTARWDRQSLAYRRTHPLCVGCLALGRTKQADVVDHVVPHRGNERLMWDQSNWQSACYAHHNVVKQRLEALFAAGKIGEAALSLAGDLAKQLTVDLLGLGGAADAGQL